LYLFRAYTCILQTSSKDLEWWANIHGVEEHEVEEHDVGGDLLWVDLETNKWFTNTNHK